MRKRVIAIAVLLCVALACLFSACGLISGMSKRTFDKVNEMSAVVDGTFESAGYTKKNASASKQSAAKGNEAAATAAKAYKGASARGVSAYAETEESFVSPLINKIKSSAKDYLTEDELEERTKYRATSNALYQGVGVAVLTKSVAQVLGDASIGKTYRVQDGNSYFDLLVSELESGYEFTGSLNISETNSAEYLNMTFSEDNGRFVFTLAFFASYETSSRIQFVYYNSEKYVANITFDVQGAANFENIGKNGDNMSLNSLELAVFGSDGCVYGFSSDEGLSRAKESVLSFLTEDVGVNGSEYLKTKNLTHAASISQEDVIAIVAKRQENALSNDYIGDVPEVRVRDSYTVPKDVKVMEKFSVPATRKLIITSQVEKIREGVLCYPQYLEEIVFEDPENGALTQIGEDDIVYEEKGHIDNPTQYFLTSFTKVKNFVLPKTVKKIAGKILIASEVETLDLRAYTGEREIKIILGIIPYNENVYYKESGCIENLYINGNCELFLSDDWDRYRYEYYCKDETYQLCNSFWEKVDACVPKELSNEEAIEEYARQKGFERKNAFITNLFAGDYPFKDAYFSSFDTVRLVENLYSSSKAIEEVTEYYQRQYEWDKELYEKIGKVNLFLSDEND